MWQAAVQPHVQKLQPWLKRLLQLQPRPSCVQHMHQARGEGRELLLQREQSCRAPQPTHQLWRTWLQKLPLYSQSGSYLRGCPQRLS